MLCAPTRPLPDTGARARGLPARPLRDLAGFGALHGAVGDDLGQLHDPVVDLVSAAALHCGPKCRTRASARTRHQPLACPPQTSLVSPVPPHSAELRAWVAPTFIMLSPALLIPSRPRRFGLPANAAQGKMRLEFGERNRTRHGGAEGHLRSLRRHAGYSRRVRVSPGGDGALASSLQHFLWRHHHKELTWEGIPE